MTFGLDIAMLLWFTLTLSRSCSKVKVIGQCSTLQEKSKSRAGMADCLKSRPELETVNN